MTSSGSWTKELCKARAGLPTFSLALLKPDVTCRDRLEGFNVNLSPFDTNSCTSFVALLMS